MLRLLTVCGKRLRILDSDVGELFTFMRQCEISTSSYMAVSPDNILCKGLLTTSATSNALLIIAMPQFELD